MAKEDGQNVVAAFQERRLREHAERAGEWYNLAVFLSVRRAWQEIDEIRKKIPASHSRDRLACDLVLCDIEQTPPAVLLSRLIEVNQVWCYYTFAKYLLRRGQVGETLALAKEMLFRNPRSVSVVNLALQFLVSVGEINLARLVLETTLGANPVQRDMEEFLQNPSSLPELYLDTAPRCFSVTFYLPMFRVEPYLRYSLEAVFSQNYPLAEVMAIDDGSPDASREIAAAYPTRVLDHGSNRGLGAARNTAFRVAQSDFVATVDTDAYPAPDYLLRAMMEFENASTRVAGVGGRLVELHRERPADLYRARYLLQDGGICRECPAPMLFGCSTVFRREAVLAVNGYGEQFRTNAEDADISRRLLEAGHWLVYTPELVAYHMRRDSPESVMQTRWRYYFWYLHQHNCYTSPTTLGHILNEYVKICEARLRQDRAEGRNVLLYLHVLMLVHSTFLDLNQAREEGMLSREQCAAYQNALWNVFSNMDAEFGGDLLDYIRRDTQHLFCGAPQPAKTRNAFFDEVFHAFLSQVSALLPRELYLAVGKSRRRVDDHYPQ